LRVQSILHYKAPGSTHSDEPRLFYSGNSKAEDRGPSFKLGPLISSVTLTGYCQGPSVMVTEVVTFGVGSNFEGTGG